jgi:putative molybdopterin biosynthesis protein
MDGVAVAAAETFGAREGRPKELVIGQNAFCVNTGHVLPAGCNAVIMIENINLVDDGRLTIEAPAFPWQHVRKVGEDIVATQLLFARHHLLTPYCLGALISAGVFEVSVLCKPWVTIIPTGSELVDWQRHPQVALAPGQVLESNAHVLAGLVEACGGACHRHDIVSDDPQQIRIAVQQALAQPTDVVLTVGGSSAGSKDYTRAVIEEMGEVLVHGVAMMPGKPVVIGAVAGKPVFGMPGYPVSTIMAFEQLVRPLLLGLFGLPEFGRTRVQVVPTRQIASKLGQEEFIRVKLGQVGQTIVATSLPRGAGSITTITEAHGLIRIPQDVEGIAEAAPVMAELLQPVETIRNTVVIVGSHDNTIDVLADQIRAGGSTVSLSSSHVGSLGGLMAIKNGVCHMAGSHLLEPADGSYNISYIRRYLPGVPVRLVNLVLRDQGLIVAKGNPKGIGGIADLARPDIAFINRQGGSGTRVLLDFKLGQQGIGPEAINGYANEEFTHMAVAVAVLSGAADAGMGIYAAARALDLDFIPVVTEQYDLVIPQAHFDLPIVQAVLNAIASPAFKHRVEALGGYHTQKTGTVIAL